MKQYQVIVLAPHVQTVWAPDDKTAEAKATRIRRTFSSVPSNGAGNCDVVESLLHSVTEIKDDQLQRPQDIRGVDRPWPFDDDPGPQAA